MERPARAVKEHTPVGPKRKFKEVLGQLSAAMVERWRNNPGIPACCKNFDENEIQLYDIDGNGTPDKLVMTCSDCGRNHTVVVSTGEAPKA